MCLLTFSWQPQQPVSLVLAANRDEFFQRPAHAMAEWPEHPGLYAGKDLEQGGSWLGVTAGKRFAALTNIRAPGAGAKDPLSRGHLVLDFLTGQQSAAQYMQAISPHASQYGLFNLLCSDGEQLWYCRNYPETHIEQLPGGLYGLSNAHLDTPWPKTQLAKQQLQQWLEKYSSAIQQPSPPMPTTLLQRREPFASDELPQTGVPPQWEKLLSSQFIHSPAYGTRCSTGLIIADQQITIEEVSWDEAGNSGSQFQHQIRT